MRVFKTSVAEFPVRNSKKLIKIYYFVKKKLTNFFISVLEWYIYEIEQPNQEVYMNLRKNIELNSLKFPSATIWIAWYGPYHVLYGYFVWFIHNPHVPLWHGREIYMIFVIYILQSIKNIECHKNIMWNRSSEQVKWFSGPPDTEELYLRCVIYYS